MATSQGEDTERHFEGKNYENSRGSQATLYLMSHGLFFFLLNKGVQLQEKKDPHLVGGSPLGFYILRVFR